MNQIGNTGIRKRTSKFAPSHGAIVFLAQQWTFLLCQHQPPKSNSKNQSGVFGGTSAWTLSSFARPDSWGSCPYMVHGAESTKAARGRPFVVSKNFFTTSLPLPPGEWLLPRSRPRLRSKSGGEL